MTALRKSCFGVDTWEAPCGSYHGRCEMNTRKLVLVTHSWCSLEQNAQHAHLCSITNRRLTHHAYIGQRCLVSTLPRPSYHGRLALQSHDNIISAVAMDDRHPKMPLLLPKARGNLFALMECGSHTIRDQLRRVRPNGPQNLNRPTPPTK